MNIGPIQRFILSCNKHSAILLYTTSTAILPCLNFHINIIVIRCPSVLSFAPEIGPSTGFTLIKNIYQIVWNTYVIHPPLRGLVFPILVQSVGPMRRALLMRLRSMRGYLRIAESPEIPDIDMLHYRLANGRIKDRKLKEKQKPYANTIKRKAKQNSTGVSFTSSPVDGS